MAREVAEREQQADQTPQPEAQPEPAPHAPVNTPAWSGSAETATAREAARPAPLPGAEAAGRLEGQVEMPSPVDVMLGSLPIPLPADAIAELRDQEQVVRRNALARAYDAVMAGSAAAAGNEKAAAAIDAGPPAMAEMARQVQATAPDAGAPLPPGVKEEMESHFGQDFSDVRVVADDQRVAGLNAGAATHGATIHFAPGELDAASPEGKSLIAHELTHVVQQRGGPDGPARVPGSASPAEQQASAVQHAVATGGSMPAVEEGTAPASAVHLGEAGVHQGIELEAAGVIAPGTDPHHRYDPDHLTPEQRAGLEMYAGNFMRDFSQFQCPKALNYLSRLPSATGPDGTVGANGAVALADAVVQCIGILELGTDIGRRLITPQNIGVYEAEQHIDNPMGTSGSGDYITRGTEADPAHTAASPEMRCVQTVDARGDQITTNAGSSDAATQATHAGSAVDGLQYENPALYEVGAGGLANHIANSTEHCKDRFLDAVRLGPGPEGRMNLGMGQHIIEDYFSHSNYIEVAFNRYINDAVGARRNRQDAAASRNPESRAAVNAFFDHFIDAEGNPREGAVSEQQGVNGEFAFVDSLYDATTPDGRQAVTTGTFGGTDTMVSLGHVLLPRLPTLETALHKGIDAIFGVVHESAKGTNPPTWQTIEGLLAEKGRPGAVAQVMLQASNTAGLAVPCPSGFEFTYLELGSLPFIGSISVPNGANLTYSNLPVTGAIETGAATYVALMRALDEFEQWSGIAAVTAAINAVKALIKQAMDALANAIRRQVSQLIAGMIQELFNIDPRRAGHAGVAELAALASEGMHELEERTSMEYRLQHGDLAEHTTGGEAGRAILEARVGPVRPRDPNGDPATFGTPANPWVTVHPLPPSHSEISKDHPPHAHDDGHPEWHPEEGPEHEELERLREEGWDQAMGHDHNEGEEEHAHEGHEHGSSFFELHYQLAVEADKHIQEQLAVIWGETVTGGEVTMDMADGAGAMVPLVGPEAPWITEAREYNARHAEFVAEFDAATAHQCIGSDGQIDPALVAAWQESKGLTADGKIGPRTAEQARELGPAGALRPLGQGAGSQAVSHADILRQASVVAGQAGAAAGDAGMRHLQTDPRRAQDLADPNVANLMNLVDYFMSHPSSSQWWVGIFDQYVSEHAEDVYASILARNRTRSQRGPE